MTVTTNTITTYDSSKSIREDLTNHIYNQSPTETPFLNSIKRGKAEHRYHEWQTETNRAAMSNAVVEADNFPTVDTFVPTNRVGNHSQISRSVIMVSGTDMAVNHAGMKEMLGHKVAQYSEILKTDMEKDLTSDNVGVVGNSSTPRKSAGLGSWVQSNWYQVATGGAPAAPQMTSGSDGYPNTAAVDGTTAVVFSETHLKTMIAKVYSNGGKIQNSFVMVGPVNKQIVSSFTGQATRFKDVPAGKQAQIIGASDVYVSDFGTVTIVPNRFQPENRAYLVDPSMAEVAYLRPFAVEKLAKNGDVESRQLIVEWTLKVKNEKSFGTVRGLTTSL